MIWVIGIWGVSALVVFIGAGVYEWRWRREHVNHHPNSSR